jgi:hypothetical protein
LIPAATAAGNVATAGTAADQGGIAADLGNLFSTVEGDGFDVTGLAANRPLRGLLRGARDAGGQPLADVATGVGSFEGIEISYAPAGALGTGPTAALAVAGDFNCAILGMRQDVTYTLSSDGIISDETGAVILNALQQDSTILRAVMRIAFATVVPANDWASGGYPFAVLNPDTTP